MMKTQKELAVAFWDGLLPLQYIKPAKDHHIPPGFGMSALSSSIAWQTQHFRGTQCLLSCLITYIKTVNLGFEHHPGPPQKMGTYAECSAKVLPQRLISIYFELRFLLNLEEISRLVRISLDINPLICVYIYMCV